jgi:hypothetical protein
MDEAAGMMALHAAVKAELGEDGLPAGGRAEVAPAEAARGETPDPQECRLKCLQESKVPVKVEFKIEFGLDEVNVEIKSEARRTDSTHVAVSQPVGPAVHNLTGRVADAGGCRRRVQPTRGTKRRSVSYAAVHSGSDWADEEWASVAPRRRRKVARITQVTTGVHGQLVLPEEDVVWEQHLASLRAYKCRHGDCNVPQSWAEDPPLGRWVDKQRARKKQLDRAEPCRGMTPVRAAKLEALGFAWELLGAGWEAQLAKLKAHKRRHGDCNVPQRWAEDPKLGSWVREQRRCKRALDHGGPRLQMTATRAAKLDALGFAWEMSAVELTKQQSKGSRDDIGWEAQLAKLEVYERRHGDYNVPQSWAEDPPLGKWVNKQRQYKKNMDRGDYNPGITAARAAKLEALGFVWSAPAGNESIWEAQLAKLMAYKRKNGDCSVPQSWAAHPRLGSWVSRQRALKKKLDRGELSPGITVLRVAKLDALGFAWELSAAAISQKQSKGAPDDAGWEAQLAKLKAYMQRHGDCNVPNRWAEDPQLGRWVKHQRQNKRKLNRGDHSPGMTAARAAKLEALGFAWELSAAAISKQVSKANRDDAGWAAQLAKLEAYKRRHGDCNVPRGWAEDPGLGSWVHNQRACKKKLDRGEPSNGMTEARAAKLEVIGFNWAPPRGARR